MYVPRFPVKLAFIQLKFVSPRKKIILCVLIDADEFDVTNWMQFKWPTKAPRNVTCYAFEQTEDELRNGYNRIGVVYQSEA